MRHRQADVGGGATIKSVKTLADIAAIAGVTPATVSRALSGHARISAATRTRVLDIAAAHGFQVNQTARNLRLGRTDAIGVVIPLGHESAQRVSDPFYTSLIGNLMDGLARRGHAMLLSAEFSHDEAWLSNVARSGRVDGIIVLCQSDQEPVLRAAGRVYQPLVVWGEPESAGDDYCCVGTDNRLGGLLATRHLLSIGRKRIAFAGLTDIPELAGRYQGYLDAHREAGAEPGPWLPAPLSVDPSAWSLREEIERHRDIDGIFAASDMIAIGAIRAAVQCGLDVPGDISVVGYDDISLAAHIMPALTTVRQDLGIAAELMLDKLFKRIAGEDAGSERIPLKLVHRQSA